MVEQWNAGAILVSLVVAITLPFELFLLAYAIVGPLHYLTEIHWIRSRSYFVPSRLWPLAGLALAIVLGLPLFIAPGGLEWFQAGTPIHTGLLNAHSLSNSALFLGGIWALSLGMKLSWKGQLAGVIGGLLFAIFGSDLWFFSVFIGVLLPTLVHVFLFTLFFMVAGALRRSSTMAWANIGLLFAATGLIWTFPFSSGVPEVSESAREIYANNTFHTLNIALLDVLGEEGNRLFSFADETLFRMQVFISFAYLHHYLNWFIKTDLIGWHRSIELHHGVSLVVIWAGCIALFVVDYRLGALSVLSLSFLHVILEFPLNVQSVQTMLKKGIPAKT